MIERFLENTLLKENISENHIRELISSSIENNLLAVCVPLCWVPLAKKIINKQKLKIITVLDFPKGKKTIEEKTLEAKTAVSYGAHEVDMVMNYELLKIRFYKQVLDEISSVKKILKNIPLKIIVETSELDYEQKIAAAIVVSVSGAQFIKTSTGTTNKGASLDDIALFRKILPNTMKIKASGGIKDFYSAKKFIEAGADRIGTSNAIQILKEEQKGES